MVQWQNINILNMFPDFVSFYFINKCSRNIKAGGQIFLKIIGFPYFKNFFLIQLNSAMFLSNKLSSSALNLTIGHIVLRRPQKQMIRIYADRIIAFMTNKKSTGNGPFVNLIGKSMSFKGFVFKMKSTISCFKYRTFPYPTTLCFYEKFQKIFFFIHLEGHINASPME